MENLEKKWNNDNEKVLQVNCFKSLLTDERLHV